MPELDENDLQGISGWTGQGLAINGGLLVPENEAEKQQLLSLHEQYAKASQAALQQQEAGVNSIAQRFQEAQEAENNPNFGQMIQRVNMKPLMAYFDHIMGSSVAQSMPDKESPAQRQARIDALGEKLQGARQGLTTGKLGALKSQIEAMKAAKENPLLNELRLSQIRANNATAGHKQEIIGLNLQEKRNKLAREKTSGENLPIDQKKLVENLAAKNANKIAIKSQIDSVMTMWPSLSETQKIVQGNLLAKTLNSPEGADAIGAEEVKRILGLLEFKKFNLTEPGSFIGRDIDEFETQVRNSSKGLEGAIKTNQGIIDKTMGREASQPSSFTPDVLSYAQKHGISPEQAQQIK